MLGTLALLVTTSLWGHAQKFDEHLQVHFAVGTKPISEGKWADMTGNVVGTFVGNPTLLERGPSEALEFSGLERLILSESAQAAGTILPAKEFSASAWVSLDETLEYGGIVGFVQDNGGEEKGWVLGYDKDHFTIALATQGADDGDGKITFLRGATSIRKSRWHHVAATYDGTVLKLYVDGKLDAETREQSGPILYPEKSEYVIGAYYDRNENFPMEGMLFEVKVHTRALAEAEVAEVAARNENLLAWAPSKNEEPRFLVQPMLQFGTTDSMTIVCETESPSRIEVRYGVTGLLEKKLAGAKEAQIHEVKISDLQTHTRYFYRVTCTDREGRTVRSPIRSFQTAPPADQPWAFGVIGDTQRNPTVTRKCAEGAFSCRPNFLLHCGDLVNDGFAKNQWLKDLFEPCAELMGHVPTFPVLGNHERDSHWYYDYFSLPAPEYYYTFHYGNAQWFMLDTNRPLKPGSEQYKWLEEELSKSKATWKFACHHHPCFSSDEDDYGDHVRGRTITGFGYGDRNAKQAIALYEKYDVDIAFNGHIHVYERTWPIFNMKVNLKDGVRYITSGGGGGNLETPAPQRNWFSLHVKRAYHYCHAVVFDRKFIFKAYDIEGRLFDTFELTKE